MARNQDDFLTDLLIRLLDEAYDYAMPSINSQTLQQNMVKNLEYVRNGVGYGRLYIDPYWALYVHDGRAAIFYAPLIWFKNPADDPRLRDNGVLDRYNQWRHLTKAEFKYWSRINRQLLHSGVSKSELPMQVAWEGVKSVQGSLFFDNAVGMRGFLPIARKILEDEFLAWLEEDLGTLLRLETNPATAVIF